MGIYAELIDLEKTFNDIRGAKPTIVNTLINQTTDQKKSINETLYTTNGDIYNNVPQCQCGEKKGKYRIGVLCNNCHTHVQEPIDEFLESLVWIAKPINIEPLINPQVWLMLRTFFSLGQRSTFDLMSYLTNNRLKINPDESANVRRIIALLKQQKMHKRGYNHFVRNFDWYMEFLFTCDVYKKKSADIDPLYYFIMNNKDKVFTNHIPVPNKSLLIIEEDQSGIYVDKSLTLALDGIRLMTGIDIFTEDDPVDSEYQDADDEVEAEKAYLKELNALTSNVVLTPEKMKEEQQALERRKRNFDKKRQNKVSKALGILSTYYGTIYKDLFSPKSGIFRKHVYGTRVDYSFRTVISSLSGPHRYDEIHIPWAVGVNVLYNHITSKLLKKGWSPNETYSFINKYNLEYNEDLDAVMKELIQEAGPKGIPVLMNRNPSLGRGSIQRVYISKIKSNPEDVTTSISLLVVTEPNAVKIAALIQ